MSLNADSPTTSGDPAAAGRRPRRRRVSFSEDFRRFFFRGLAALLPTLITLWLVVWAVDFLWESLGRYLIELIKIVWLELAAQGIVFRPPAYIGNYWAEDQLHTKVIGVGLAVLVVYIVGLFVGNLIGRTFWTLLERAVMKIPIVRAIYPAAKQITDFLITDRSKQDQFAGSRVVAVHARDPDVWSIGLVTAAGGLPPLAEATNSDMVTVFIPSSPTAFSGYVVVVPRSAVIDLPLKVEEAMRLLVSGGVLAPADVAPAGSGSHGVAGGLPPQGATATPPSAGTVPAVRRGG